MKDFPLLTPSDISRVKFRISFRGYNTQEVDEFLEHIQFEYTRIWKENMELKNQLDFLKKELETYKKMENIINESVITSKKLAEDIKYQAHNEAKYIISKAQMQAEKIKEDCERVINNLVQDIKKLIDLRCMLVSETKAYMVSMLERLENIEKIFNSTQTLALLPSLQNNVINDK
ncbi:MAG: DivIVA domain-containing protein [bacterium]